MVSKGNHPQIALFQASEIIQFTQIYDAWYIAYFRYNVSNGMIFFLILHLDVDLPHIYWWFIVDLPIQNGDFP